MAGNNHIHGQRNCMHVVQIQKFRRKSKKPKFLFSRNKKLSLGFKRGQTKWVLYNCSEIISYQKRPQKHKPQEIIITQCTWNKRASWPPKVKLRAAKMRFTQSKLIWLECFMHCAVPCRDLRAREKRRKTCVLIQSKGHVSHYHELMTPGWPVNT